MASIIELEDEVNKLLPADKELFESIFDVSSSEAELEIPATFRAKVRGYFGERDEHGRIVESEDEVVERVRIQKVIKTFNKWTEEGALFNWLRASRPGMKSAKIEEEKRRVYEHIEEKRKDCDFCDPKRYTSADIFGRIEGSHCITGANVAKYDAYTGMVYFNNHNPLEFSKEELSDYIETGFKWFEEMHKYKEEFKYPFFMWNCLEKAGASQVHGHAQLLMGKGMHYGKVQVLRRVFQQYKREQGRDYFDDLFKVHDLVGLALLDGDVKIFAYLTPVKEKETVIITSTAPSVSSNAKNAIFKTLRCYIDKLGMASFNLTISMPPLNGHDDDFPYIVRIVDRGNFSKPTADVGGMELYGSSVIATDPYTIIKVLKEFYSK